MCAISTSNNCEKSPYSTVAYPDITHYDLAMLNQDEVRIRVELRELVDQYAVYYDDRNSEGVASLFLPDGVMSAANPGKKEPFGSLNGRGDLLQLVDHSSDFVRTFFAVHNHLVSDINGDTAKGITYSQGFHLLEEGEAAKTIVQVMRYYDDYSYVDGSWHFAKRHVQNMFSRTVPPIRVLTLSYRCRKAHRGLSTPRPPRGLSFAAQHGRRTLGGHRETTCRPLMKSVSLLLHRRRLWFRKVHV